MFRMPGVLLLAVGAIVLGAGTAAAADTTPWQVKTASNSYGSNRANYSYTLAAGGEVQDAFVVLNRGKTPLELAVYAGDAFTTPDGELDLRGSDSKDLGTWVHADRKQVKVLPGKSVEVPFKIAVPADARPGDHLGGVITSLTQNDVERRLAIRIRLRVSGELKPSLAVEDLKVRYSGSLLGNGDATVAYEIRNTGNTIAAARQTASVSGPFGRLKAQSGGIADSPQLLPGETWKVSVPVEGVTPAGRLTGAVELLPLVTDAAGSTATFAAVETTAHAWTIPWPLLLLLVLVAAGAVLVIRRVRGAILRK
ncbi:MAG: hypothetical protein QOH84_338 [Kribbellaceae bacterium]|nr:hypothetical protein [Kribbellaceae bacterium]